MATYLSRAAVAAADVWAHATRTLSAMGAFTNYSYNTDLAIGATYTPPAKTIFGVTGEAFGGSDLKVQGYDVTNAAWRLLSVMSATVDSNFIGMFIQDDNQRLRIINGNGSNARDLSCFGVTWT